MGKPKFVYNIDARSLDLCFSSQTRAQIQSLVQIDDRAPEKMSPDRLAQSLDGATGIISGWGAVALTEGVLQHADELKVIHHSAGSIKGLATDAVWKRRIRVTSNAHVNAVPVAAFNLGIILTSLKNVFGWQDRFARAGRSAWRRDDTVPGYYGSVVGIVGIGLECVTN